MKARGAQNSHDEQDHHEYHGRCGPRRIAPDDFPAMMEVDRYGKRSTAFDKIISATHDHFWDPLDKKYIDFSRALRHGERVPDRSRAETPNLKLPACQGQARREGRRSSSSTWTCSGASPPFSTAKQGALSALGEPLPHPEAIRARRNMPRTRRARKHATLPASRELRARRAGASPLRRRPGARRPAHRTSSNSPEVYKKIVGMQMLVEGLAMGAFATLLQAKSNDPLLVKLTQLVDDGRSLPSQVRQDLGGPHHPEPFGRKSATSSRTGRRKSSRRCSSTS